MRKVSCRQTYLNTQSLVTGAVWRLRRCSLAGRSASLGVGLEDLLLYPISVLSPYSLPHSCLWLRCDPSASRACCHDGVIVGITSPSHELLLVVVL